MKDKSIIIFVPLNIASYKDVTCENNSINDYFDVVNKEKENIIWIKNRINIFMNYTYRSLVNQTNQDFTACVVYSDETEETVISELINYGSTKGNIIFIKESLADMLIKQKILGSEYVYFIRIDSDDMYHKSYIQKIYDYKPLLETVALVNQWGYFYDSFNNKINICCSKVTSCYTLIFKTEEYLSGKIPTIITNQLDTAMGIAWGGLSKEYLYGLNYVWHVHSKNTLTTGNDWFTNEWINYLSEPIEDAYYIDKIISEFRG